MSERLIYIYFIILFTVIICVILLYIILLTIYLFVPVRTFILASLNCVTGELRAYREGAQVDLSVSKLVPEIYYSRLILNEVTHPLHRKQNRHL